MASKKNSMKKVAAEYLESPAGTEFVFVMAWLGLVSCFVGKTGVARYAARAFTLTMTLAYLISAGLVALVVTIVLLPLAVLGFIEEIVREAGE